MYAANRRRVSRAAKADATLYGGQPCRHMVELKVCGRILPPLPPSHIEDTLLLTLDTAIIRLYISHYT
jgi:hypothetical protein